jgi:hypothetical protein
MIFFLRTRNEILLQHAHLPSTEVFFTPKIVGTFYMQGYKVKEKTAIVPHCTPSFKTQWTPCYYGKKSLNGDGQQYHQYQQN